MRIVAIGTLAALCVVVANAGSYVAFPNMDITGNNDMNPNNNAPYISTTGATFSMSTYMTLCDDAAQQGRCHMFDVWGWLKTWKADSSKQSFLSNTTCGASTTARLISGTPLSPPGTQYLVCTGSGLNDAEIVAFANYQLPPFLVEQACDKNPECVGFMVSSDESQGWLLRYEGGGSAAYVVVRLS